MIGKDFFLNYLKVFRKAFFDLLRDFFKAGQNKKCLKEKWRLE
jgi:hypothetical protein